MVWNSDSKKIYRLEGTPDGSSARWPGSGSGAALNTNFFTISMIKNASTVVSSDTISQIVSMEYYGLFVNVANKKVFIEIEPDKIMTFDSKGLISFSNVATFEHSYGASPLMYDDTA